MRRERAVMLAVADHADMRVERLAYHLGAIRRIDATVRGPRDDEPAPARR